MAKDDRGIVLSEEQRRRRRSRDMALALPLAALVVLFYVITVFKLGGEVLDRPI